MGWPKHFNYARKTSNVKNDKKIDPNESALDKLLSEIDKGVLKPGNLGEERRVLNPPPPPKKPKKWYQL